MPTLKEISIEVINQLPNNCSLEEIMYSLQLAAQAFEGLNDEKKSNTVSMDQLQNITLNEAIKTPEQADEFMKLLKALG